MDKIEEIEWDDNRKKINELVEGYNEIMKRLERMDKRVDILYSPYKQ